MSQTITFPLPTGTNYVIPDVGDENWGQNVTNFLVAIPDGVMPTSGTFTLTGDVSFGPTFGLVSQYFKSATISPASTGFLRLAKTDALEWRNNANSADLALAINGSDQLTFDGNPITVDGVTSITGTANQIIASASTGAITLSTPQDIAPASSPTFAGLTLSAPLTVQNGGTGAASFTAYSVVCGGTTSTAPLQNVSGVGLSGQFLQSQGAGLLPIWANVAGTGTVNSGTAGHAAYYATSTNAVSDGGSANIQVGSLTAVAASFQLEISPSGGNSILLTASAPAADRTYTLPDRGANDTFAFLGGQAQTFTGAATFSSASGVAITPTSNQLVLGTTRTATITAPTPAVSSRTYAFPDQGADYSVVATEGTQTINGAKTLTSPLAMRSQKITGVASGTVNTDVTNFKQVITYSTNAHWAQGSTNRSSTTGAVTWMTEMLAVIVPKSTTPNVFVVANIWCLIPTATGIQLFLGQSTTPPGTTGQTTNYGPKESFYNGTASTILVMLTIHAVVSAISGVTTYFQAGFGRSQGAGTVQVNNTNGLGVGAGTSDITAIELPN